MLRNYLTVAMRNLLRYRVYAAVNVAGLAIAMACAFLILGYIRFELTFDTHHEYSDRIYRIVKRFQQTEGGDFHDRANTGAPLAPFVRAEVPGAERVARIAQHRGGSMRRGDVLLRESGLYYADPEILDILTIPFERGDPATALDQPNAVVLTPRAAARYFRPGEDPLGQTLTLDGRDLSVTGIVRPAPPNSHFRYDLIASFQTLHAFVGGEYFEQNWDSRAYAYLRLPAGVDTATVNAQLAGVADRHADWSSFHWGTLRLQPVLDIHMSRMSAELDYGGGGNEGVLRVLRLLAAVILFIAAINFINLSTARAATRAREVGLRKVVGSQRRQLVAQFLGESLVLSAIGLVLGLAAAELLLPAFSGVAGRDLRAAGLLGDPLRVGGAVAIALLVGVAAGIYPAFVLSSLRPTTVLKGQAGLGGSRSFLRRGLVVVQFALSVVLVVNTLLLHRQYGYLLAGEVGFDRQHLISLPAAAVWRQYGVFKQALLAHPEIAGVTGCSHEPGVGDSHGIQIRKPGAGTGVSMGILYTDADYVQTLDLKLADGRGFDAERPADAHQAMLLNQAALRQLGDDYGVGQPVELFFLWEGQEVVRYTGTVVGILEDFHHDPLYTSVPPMAFGIADDPGPFGVVLVRVRPGDPLHAVGVIRQEWQQLFPDAPFASSFVDEDIRRVYAPLARAQTLLVCFSCLAVFVACLGMFGLASYSTARRTREIGVRKVLGASVAGVVGLLSRELIALVVAANLVAWPLAWHVTSLWLTDFPYRIDVGADAFLLVGAATLLLALLTVSGQAVRAALTNPVDVLRCE